MCGMGAKVERATAAARKFCLHVIALLEFGLSELPPSAVRKAERWRRAPPPGHVSVKLRYAPLRAGHSPRDQPISARELCVQQGME